MSDCTHQLKNSSVTRSCMYGNERVRERRCPECGSLFITLELQHPRAEEVMTEAIRVKNRKTLDRA